MPATTNCDDVTDTDALLSTGLIDSLSFVDLVAFLAGKYGVTVSELDMVPENFDTIEAMARFVARKQNGRKDA